MRGSSGVRCLLLLLLAGAASGLEVYLVAARGRPIGPPQEQEAPFERAQAGAEGMVIGGDEEIPGSRAEFLLSSPPSDLPILRESVKSMALRPFEEGDAARRGTGRAPSLLRAASLTGSGTLVVLTFACAVAGALRVRAALAKSLRSGPPEHAAGEQSGPQAAEHGMEPNSAQHGVEQGEEQGEEHGLQHGMQRISADHGM